MRKSEETLKTYTFDWTTQHPKTTRYETRMTDPTVVIIGSFLLAFKAILIEGSEVAMLSLATIKQLGRNNILFGVIAGGLGSILTFLVVWRIFLLLPAIIIDLATDKGPVFSSTRFLLGFFNDAIRPNPFIEKKAASTKN